MSSDDTEPRTPKPISPELPTIKITHRRNRTWQTFLLHHLIRPFNSLIGRPDKEFPEGSPKLDLPTSVTGKCHVTERQAADIWIYDLTLRPKSPASNADVLSNKKLDPPYRIYYFGGGGWARPPSASHYKFFVALLEALPKSTIVSIVSYPLAPKSPAPKAFPVLLKWYAAALEESKAKGEIVTFAGDSAGGNIVLCLPLEALRQDINAPKPASIMAICPSADAERENPLLKEVEKHDPVLRLKFLHQTASGWAGEWDRKDPRLSPLRSRNLDVFKTADIKVDGCTGGYDILGVDGIMLRDKLGIERVEGDWLEWDKMMHCWPLAKVYGILPESEEGFQWVVKTLKKRLDEAGEARAAGATSNGSAAV